MFSELILQLLYEFAIFQNKNGGKLAIEALQRTKGLHEQTALYFPHPSELSDLT